MPDGDGPGPAVGAALPATEPAAGAAALVAAAKAAGLTVATAESLTAGLVAATIADVPGASGVLQGGVVSYQVEVKAAVLGVSRERLEEYGPVDRIVAQEMAAGARRVCGADIGISTTGVAGPEPHGGHAVGTVWIGISSDLGDRALLLDLEGDRGRIRRGSVDAALTQAGVEVERLVVDRR
ncbi:CinA family protein [Galactobacter sp.]|uniref:CinA family protein n=1 Tax=Galactobacter sp. TaxID=2676125 RepID=UPI0025BD352C|nr:CinA family protein [Galactobacter sp.]